MQATTKANLIAFIEAQGFEIIDATPTANKECWTLACPEEDEEENKFQVRVDALKQHSRKGSNIVCPRCKTDAKLQKFLKASNMWLLITDDDKLFVRCRDCELSYRYTGNFYRPYSCFCRLRTRRQEHAFYKGLHHFFPEQVAREVVYVGNHKCDIALYLKDKTIYIEIDEIGHKYSPKKELDEFYQQQFEAKAKAHEFLYRIDERLIKENVEDVLARMITQFEIPRPEENL